MSRENIVTCNLCKATTTEHFERLRGWKHIEIRDAFEFSRAVHLKEFQIDLCPTCFDGYGLGNLLPKPAGVAPIAIRREGLL